MHKEKNNHKLPVMEIMKWKLPSHDGCDIKQQCALQTAQATYKLDTVLTMKEELKRLYRTPQDMYMYLRLALYHVDIL